MLTYRDLLNEISKMSDEQKDMPVAICRSTDEIVYFDNFKTVNYFANDIYRNDEYPEETGTLKELKEAYGDDFNLDNFQIAIKKDTPYLGDVEY